MAPQITRYAPHADGRYNIGIDVTDRITVLITPRDVDAQAAAEFSATLIADQHEEVNRLRAALDESRNALIRAKANATQAENALDAALKGTRRFFGPVLLKPEMPGDWKGAVWLLDPDKQEKGWGLRFDSLADVRREYSELWIAARVNDGILLDAAPIPTK